ncbi:MAG TPA: SRPBCC family protein [Devosia sp.]|uniref:SRPBCC family protein n=1 Tax=Devosia sp. TaxID=1871048 RepID=UPI002F955E2F
MYSVVSELDLELSRVIRAPRAQVWNAWVDPTRLAQWWIPKPMLCRVLSLDVRPGGSFVTQMSENGEDFLPHLTGCFLDAVEQKRIVYTNSLTGGWRPASKGFVTAIIDLADHPDGTLYRAVALHKSRADRETHEELGFHDGWGTVVAQLAQLVETSN